MEDLLNGIDCKRLLVTDEIAEGMRKRAVENSVARLYPELKDAPDREIAQRHLRFLNTEILWNAVFGGTRMQTADRDETEFMECERKAVDMLLRRNGEDIPELHDANLYADFITELQWNEMTREQRAEEEREVERLLEEG